MLLLPTRTPPPDTDTYRDETPAPDVTSFISTDSIVLLCLLWKFVWKLFTPWTFFGAAQHKNQRLFSLIDSKWLRGFLLQKNSRRKEGRWNPPRSSHSSCLTRAPFFPSHCFPLNFLSTEMNNKSLWWGPSALSMTSGEIHLPGKKKGLSSHFHKLQLRFRRLSGINRGVNQFHTQQISPQTNLKLRQL